MSAFYSHSPFCHGQNYSNLTRNFFLFSLLKNNIFSETFKHESKYITTDRCSFACCEEPFRLEQPLFCDSQSKSSSHSSEFFCGMWILYAFLFYLQLLIGHRIFFLLLLSLFLFLFSSRLEEIDLAVNIHLTLWMFRENMLCLNMMKTVGK